VQGVIWGTELPQAIINNKVVKVGDTIEEVRILDIQKGGITVFYKSRNYTISSPAGVDLQPKAQTGVEKGHLHEAGQTSILKGGNNERN
jgi:hypothetical protein